MISSTYSVQRFCWHFFCCLLLLMENASNNSFLVLAINMLQTYRHHKYRRHQDRFRNAKQLSSRGGYSIMLFNCNPVLLYSASVNPVVRGPALLHWTTIPANDTCHCKSFNFIQSFKHSNTWDPFCPFLQRT